MIKGMGIDIIENKRIEKSLNDDFLSIVLTSNELEIYHKRKGKKKLQFLSGRYAAKEAIIKALNKYENPHFLEIEILNHTDGSPYVLYKDYPILISISHEENYSVAEAILLDKKN